MYVNYNETDLNELYSTIQTISACVCPPNTPNIPEQSTGFAITIKYDSNAQMQIYIAINKKYIFAIVIWNGLNCKIYLAFTIQ